jgi:hypothetical protein
MRALTALSLADNNLGKMVPPEGWSYGYHGDYSGNAFYKHTDGRKMKNGTPEGTTSGAIVIAAVIPDMGALSSLNLLNNVIPVEQAQELVKIMQSKEKLTTLCGLSVNETTLDFSNQGLGPGDAVLIANDISDMGALTSLNVANNKLGGLVDSASNIWTYFSNQWWCNGDNPPADNKEGYKDAKPVGVILLANAIKDMRALSVLNLAKNNLGELVLPEGWTKDFNFDTFKLLYKHTDGREQKDQPCKPEGIIAIANAIPDMRSLTKLDISNNNMEQGPALRQITECCCTKGVELDSHDSDDGDY